MLRGTDRINAFYVALVGSLVALVLRAAVASVPESLRQRRLVGARIFTGMLVYDQLHASISAALLLLFAVLFLIFTRLSGIPDREDVPIFTRWCWAARSACA